MPTMRRRVPNLSEWLCRVISVTTIINHSAKDHGFVAAEWYDNEKVVAIRTDGKVVMLSVDRRRAKKFSDFQLPANKIHKSPDHKFLTIQFDSELGLLDPISG